jgi:hypothetical protein
MDLAVMWRIDLVTPLYTLNTARSKHWRAWAKHTAAVREMAREATETAQIPRLAECRIVALPLQKRGPLADIGGHFPTIKAAIDGIVDAGVLEDDDPKHLVAMTIRPGQMWSHTGLSLAVYADDLTVLTCHDSQTEGAQP